MPKKTTKKKILRSTQGKRKKIASRKAKVKFKKKISPKKATQKKSVVAKSKLQSRPKEKKVVESKKQVPPTPAQKKLFPGDFFEPEERELPQIQKAPAKLTGPQIDELRQMLLDERKKILDRLSQHVSEAVDDIVPEADELDQAGTSSNQAYLLRLADKEQKLLREIDNALGKFANGDYGYCEGTGELIGYERLKIRPWTKYSIKHKEMLEHREGKRRKTFDI